MYIKSRVIVRPENESERAWGIAFGVWLVLVACSSGIETLCSTLN